jgi:hypothetical protein
MSKRCYRKRTGIEPHEGKISHLGSASRDRTKDQSERRFALESVVHYCSVSLALVRHGFRNLGQRLGSGLSMTLLLPFFLLLTACEVTAPAVMR